MCLPLSEIAKIVLFLADLPLICARNNFYTDLSSWLRVALQWPSIAVEIAYYSRNRADEKVRCSERWTKL